jgi:hypothetical protein
LIMASVGIVIFFTGRMCAKKFYAEGSHLMPASMITARGIAAYLCTLASWAGALLTVVCMLLLFF